MLKRLHRRRSGRFHNFGGLHLLLPSPSTGLLFHLPLHLLSIAALLGRTSPVKSLFPIALKPTGPVFPGQSSSSSPSRANRFMPPEPTIVVQNNVRSRSTPLVPLLPVQHGSGSNNQQPSGIPKISEDSLSSSPAVARGDTDVVPTEVRLVLCDGWRPTTTPPLNVFLTVCIR